MRFKPGSRFRFYLLNGSFHFVRNELGHLLHHFNVFEVSEFAAALLCKRRVETLRDLLLVLGNLGHDLRLVRNGPLLGFLYFGKGLLRKLLFQRIEHFLLLDLEVGYLLQKLAGLVSFLFLDVSRVVFHLFNVALKVIQRFLGALLRTLVIRVLFHQLFGAQQLLVRFLNAELGFFDGVARDGALDRARNLFEDVESARSLGFQILLGDGFVLERFRREPDFFYDRFYGFFGRGFLHGRVHGFFGCSRLLGCRWFVLCISRRRERQRKDQPNRKNKVVSHMVMHFIYGFLLMVRFRRLSL